MINTIVVIGAQYFSNYSSFSVFLRFFRGCKNTPPQGEFQNQKILSFVPFKSVIKKVKVER